MPATHEKPKLPRCFPLSRKSRVRILRGLVARADAGDALAAEVIIRLSMLAEGAKAS